MTRVLRAGVMVLVALLFSSGGYAQETFNWATMGTRSRVTRPSPPSSVAASMPAATVRKSISITRLSDLGFGDVIPGSTAGTVIITPTGTRTATGGTALGGPHDEGPAMFRVLGEPGEEYAIVLPITIALSLPRGVSRMVVDAFRSSPSREGVLDSSGSQTLKVGATLHVGELQARGTYSGTFHVTVAYD